MNSNEMGMLEKAIDSGINSEAKISYINFELSSEKELKYKDQANYSCCKKCKNKGIGNCRGVWAKT